LRRRMLSGERFDLFSSLRVCCEGIEYLRQSGWIPIAHYVVRLLMQVLKAWMELEVEVARVS
jgi:hypothetical protein